jgi:endonuclease/exonuclease/phosphatase family metal-dependent hydrolase
VGRAWGISLFILLILLGGGYWWWRSQRPENGALTAPAATAPTKEFRVTLLNLRLPLARDGDNAWPLRSNLAIETLKSTGADIIGLQECSGMQSGDLLARMPDFSTYPDGRDDSTLGGLVPVNFTLIMYRKDRFDAIDYSNGTVREGAPANPEISAYYSMVILRDKTKTLPDLIVINTHIRHNPILGAEEARVLNQRITAQMRLHKGAQAILLGDMNADKNSMVYPGLIGKQSAGAATQRAVTPMRDTYDYAAKPSAEKWGSYHAFTGKPAGDLPTDFIFVSDGLAADPAKVLRESHNGKFPSDHFPVTVKILAK